jgi:hypothetical protein
MATNCLKKAMDTGGSSVRTILVDTKEIPHTKIAKNIRSRPKNLFFM